MKSALLRARYFASPVAYVCLVLTLLVSCEFGLANLLFKPLCGQKTAYRQNFLGNPEAAETNTACGILCLANNACFSFTYHRGNRLCQLSTGVEETCNLLEMETDSTYYVVVSMLRHISYFTNDNKFVLRLRARARTHRLYLHRCWFSILYIFSDVY